MSPTHRPSLLEELKRRKVVRVGVVYAAVAYAVTEAADLFVPALALPESLVSAIALVAVLGFPIALVLAWAFEVTPEGVKRTEAGSGGEVGHGWLSVRTAVVVSILVGLGIGGGWMAGRASSPPTGDGELSIAVLPFVNLSSDPEQEFFSDGISEEILNALAPLTGLRVTSRTSAFAFKGQSIGIPEIAGQLGVAYILEGSVRKAGARVRINAQLIEAATDARLWSEVYQRQLDDIFAIQDAIAHSVTEALQARLLGLEAPAAKATASAEGYEKYLRAQALLRAATFEGLVEAETHLLDVIASDPDYAPAHAALALTYYDMGGFGSISFQEAATSGAPHAERAVALDPELPDAWWSLSRIRFFDDDPAGAEIALARVEDLAPDHPGLLAYRLATSAVGPDPTGALELAERATLIDPFSSLIHQNQGWLLERLGRFEEAARSHQRALQLSPDDPSTAGYAAVNAGWGRGLWTEAGVHLLEASRLESADPELAALLGQVYLDLGGVGEAARLVERALDLGPESVFGNAIQALLLLSGGSSDAAGRVAERVLESGVDLRFSSRAIFARTLRDRDVAEGRPDVALDRYLALYPQLETAAFGAFRFSLPAEDLIYATVDAAAVVQRMGERERANSLLEKALGYTETWSRMGYFRASGIADAEIYALQGRRGEALTALREAQEAGWRLHWRWRLENNPNFDSLKDDPEFTAIVEAIRREAADDLVAFKAGFEGG